MFGAILGMVIPISLVVVIVRATQGRSDLSGESATVSLRRFFHYLVLLGLGIISSLGVAGLLAQVLPETGTLVRTRSSAEPLALAFTIVGVPLFVVLSFLTRRRLQADPNEADSLGWAFYLSVMQLVGLAVVMTTSVRAFDWGLSDGGLDTTDVAHGIVWLVVWGAHWAVAGRTIRSVRMVPHVIVGSAAGLGVLLAGLASALGASLGSLYAALFETVLVDDLEGLLRESVGLVVVGGIVWWWYWRRNAAKGERTTLWNVYALLVAVLGGLLMTLVWMGAIIATALEWGFGGGGAVEQFDDVPEAVTAVLLAAGVWLYHRLVTAGGWQSDVRSAYRYLVTAVGLGAVAGAIGSGVFALLDVATETSSTLASDAGEGAAIAAITLLVLGLPVWLVSWSRVGRRVRIDPEVERRSTARRVYLFGTLGVGAVASIVALIVFVFTISRDLLDGELGASSIRDGAGAVGILIAAVAVVGYHWTVYQQDRAELPEEPETRLREVVYVGNDGRDVARAIERETGARVYTWERSDEQLQGAVVPPDIVEAVKRAGGDRVLVIQRARGAFDIIPIRR